MGNIQDRNRLTWAESKIIDFLELNKGEAYTAEEIEYFTDVRADLIDDIAENLRFKGYEIASRHGKHWFVHNTIWSFITGAAIFAIMFSILIYAFFN